MTIVNCFGNNLHDSHNVKLCWKYTHCKIKEAIKTKRQSCLGFERQNDSSFNSINTSWYLSYTQQLSKVPETKDKT